MMDPADTEAPPVANFSINRLGHSVIESYLKNYLKLVENEKMKLHYSKSHDHKKMST